MTGKIFKEWLQWFNQQVSGRKVVLLINGFSAHHTGMKLLREEDLLLENVQIRFLPENSTSLCQPLDQGIIRAWKAYYKQRWLRFAVDQFEQDQDPAKNLTILQAIRWIISAWQNDITVPTIANCWLQSRVLAPKIGPQTREEAEKAGWREDLKAEEMRYNATMRLIDTSIRALAELKRIEEAMAVAQFINPDTERVQDDDEEDLDCVLDQVAESYSQESTLADPEEVEQVIPPIKIADALASLATLRLYEEQQEDGSREAVQALNKLEREIRGRQTANLTQRTLDSFFIAN
jgi:DDE superfamily endonuclease